MRALATAIQEARSDLHLSVDELAERAGIPAEAVWRLLDDGAGGSGLEPVVLDRLARSLHRPCRLLYQAALLDAGWISTAR
jgi:transcriptional regulator with XRE-family HTH domain